MSNWEKKHHIPKVSDLKKTDPQPKPVIVDIRNNFLLIGKLGVVQVGAGDLFVPAKPSRPLRIGIESQFNMVIYLAISLQRNISWPEN